ncbi:hypothetical protein Pfo_031114 [Paulownia fortunei]|nr:hypothetical protein Pfo_018899 [Paulownia fortunei]KAI3472322.1 hypothetical protein Pfo_031114 [Paulownia fortunei]
MGSCLSKKNACASSSPVALPNPPEKLKSESQLEKKKTEEETVVKKEIFIIKHRKSHEVERQRSDEEKGEVKKAEEVVEKGKNVSATNGLDGGLGNGSGIMGVGGGAPVRTSSCTKEEVDAILIQCGRLSRSSSTGKAGLSSENGGRKYSGSKRSYDFDNENGKSDGNNVVDGDADAVTRERENRRRERHRQSQGRRRTPSREREKDQAGQQRSGSRERCGSGGGRRVSRSPGRRSESPISTTCSGANSNSSAANANSRPGKMVSVPATVSSLAMDKSTNAGGGAEPNSTAVKRIQVKRNVGGDGAVGTRTAASPRARSPARVRAANENQNVNSSQNQQQPQSLSRSNSRKAEHSPYRRNPLSEIDTNIISQAPIQKPNADNRIVQGAENRINSSKLESNNLANVNCKNQEQQLMAEETKGPYGIAGHVALNVISSGPENLKTHAVTRSRSSRLSRDLDINPETLSNPNVSSSYTALLLEDIQNFHQKNTPPAAFSLPPCVTKACSILEAVADLNSSTGSNLSSTFSEDQRRNPITEQMNKSNDNKKPSSAVNPVRKTKPEIRDPILESEVVANDDLMEPSFHKYVTVRRGTTGGEDLEEQESSGSNSYVGSQQPWVSSSSWEPNSAESTDRWTSSSRSVSRQNDVSPVGFQRHAISESGRGVEEGGKRLSAKKRDSDHQQNGIGRSRIGTRGSHMAPAATAST